VSFANCKEIAITVSGNIPDSEICYGMYSPITPRKIWDKGWQKEDSRLYPSFTHFWVEKDGLIFDNAAEQFGELEEVITDQTDIRYVKVGKYNPETGEVIPLVSNPIIEWETLTGIGGIVNVVWEKYDEYINKIKFLSGP